MAARAFALSLLAACAVLGAGCGGSGSTGPPTRINITRDYGASTVSNNQRVAATTGLTALRQLESLDKVTTSYGGRYVKSINGTAEDSDSSWLFYVNGVESKVGAASTRLKPGQVVQWDFHAWQNIRTGGAIVGAYPLPLKTRGVHLICAPTHSKACSVARRSMNATGIVTDARSPDRMIVGAWSDIQGYDGVPDLTAPGDTNGAYAQFSSDGHTLAPFYADGSSGRRIKVGGGLLAPFAIGRGIVWLVTGTDAAGTLHAAKLLAGDGVILRNKFAMAVEPNFGSFPLPRGSVG